MLVVAVVGLDGEGGLPAFEFESPAGDAHHPPKLSVDARFVSKQYRRILMVGIVAILGLSFAIPEGLHPLGQVGI